MFSPVLEGIGVDVWLAVLLYTSISGIHINLTNWFKFPKNKKWGRGMINRWKFFYETFLEKSKYSVSSLFYEEWKQVKFCIKPFPQL